MIGHPNTFTVGRDGTFGFQAQPATFLAAPPTFPSAPPTFPPVPGTPRRRRTRRSPPPTPAEMRSQRCALLLIIYVMVDVKFNAGSAEN